MTSAPAEIAGTRRHDLVSSATGRTYRLFVHTPKGEAPAGGWPVLYLTDGNAVIATAVDALRAQACYPSGTNVGFGVIVAIGYPTDEAYDSLRRSWDLSPLPGKTYPPFSAGGPEVKTGGGEEFLAFVEDEVKPFVARLAPLDSTRQTLFGHSFGGLFTLYAFFTRPRAFARWVSASPAIYWDEELIHSYRDRFLAAVPEDLDAVLHLSAGEYEGDVLAPFQIGAPDAESRLAHKKTTRTIRLAEELAARLDRLPGTRIRATCETFAGETHMSVLPVAVNRAIQIAFAARET